MQYNTLILAIVLLIAPIANADIVLLGDNARVRLLKQCGPTCSAGTHRVRAPGINARASEVASLAGDASHAIVIVDATQGPLPVTREHVLIARQARVPSLSIMFVNLRELEGMADAAELLELEELEVREVFNLYEMGGDRARVFHDNAIEAIPDLRSNGVGFDSLLASLKAVPERKKTAAGYVTGKTLDTYVYLLTPEEAQHTASLARGSAVNLWVNGQAVKGRVTSGMLSPGSNGELGVVLETPVKAAEGSRYLLENNGQIIAAGVVVRVGN